MRWLQANQGDCLPSLTGLPQADLVDLLALCGVLTVNALPSTGLSGNAGAIAAAAGLDMADWWKAAAEGYLNHVLIARIVQALKEAGPDLANSGSDALNKGDLVAAAAKRLAGTRWLPQSPRADQTRAVSGLRVEPAAYRWLEYNMWLLIAREPQPDAPYWRGRRWLAAVDAVAWPVLCAIVAQQLPQPTGVVSPFALAMAVLFGIGRLHRAVWVNHRYRFTTWRWGKFAAVLLVIGLVMKLAMLR